MSNFWAIAVGINHYQFLQPLHFAQSDAQFLCESLVGDAGFSPEQCLLITDTSPDFADHSTHPTHENLQYWTTSLKDKLQPEDSLWCFFSGYGICVDGEDYLLPIDGDVSRIKETGFSVRSLFQTLKTLPTQKILVLLDINRAASGSHEKVGTQTVALAREAGIPTFLSCRPEQFSHEAPALNHGLFTQTLLEGLRSHQCSTLATLEDFLKLRLPELCDHNDRPRQDPILVVSDPEQLYQVIMPVNWSETESWVPATTNPFSVEGDLYLNALESEASSNYGFQPTVMGATATEIPDSFALNPSEYEYEPIQADLTLPESEQTEELSPAASPVPEESDAPDQMFWERLLFGGSALLLVLLLGVLFRNWSAFMGGQQTANTQPSPAPQAVASPSPDSGKILNEARSLIKPTLASDASRAIDRARAIPPNDPLYAEAQQDIDRWSRNILEIARKRAEQKEFQQAISAAQLVPKDRPQVYAEAQKAIQQWRKAR
ncbi:MULTISPECIES: caspase family protein [Leptolyngbya]|jgi:hypothetical protein|uniref:Caspase family protein n=2 Tax=Leptolyngbya boryana TaxID=1184 RepID=A0AA96WXI9_LEPBY|nr:MULTISPECIES: caspase family protein [Leptolyngbya]BAY57584.1 putative Peptidase C14, caspase catalytic subunit p20 [Leptolyngbya boryana NIES-2135]MBD1858280.1 caspase family protein [Leptolyngbya sp. FACHB-1624]MBD2367541.1 caspase family protein [Leptolyngbya sp. FACHB-161]MBD2374065.1 caspase family protein [Leptolyngbya sp. FACHB-238]MBD2398690.1 caspase family protein [Leptolyngbya sp. FACHB-239]